MSLATMAQGLAGSDGKTIPLCWRKGQALVRDRHLVVARAHEIRAKLES